ncbi:uncharacterized protein KY384_006595 [Bacidia gigantensis]|uniref:uncharacterized protein n=1 Tax=Bacidia gigantensis TaxID=2732470 RepID=UPI001D04406A|nr:uncharacterized protein KY384_006595 [Bacidia gigantensis]KAG8528906.1 hypothetical protein KY384_006595 [Bacidia gigantensis]
MGQSDYSKNGEARNATDETPSARDILVCIQDERLAFKKRYPCSRSLLRQNSKYFDRLLDPDKFEEGRRIEQELHERAAGNGLAHEKPLPTITVSDLPLLFERPSRANESDLAEILTLFLRMLHGVQVSWPFSGIKEFRSLEFLARLAIIADFFSAPDILHGFVRKVHNNERAAYNGLFGMKNKVPETVVRQQLLIGILLSFSPWIWSGSNYLICKGSGHWSQSSQEDTRSDDGQVAWNMLPNGIEEELFARRQYVLQTISSIQSHFVGLYSSKLIQCKKGYANSTECDSFQLGEMIKFFTRKGSLQMRDMYMQQEAEIYNGDMRDLIARLKECPKYQIDSYHQHCGARTRILPILEALQNFPDYGICMSCWQTDRTKESWLDNPSGGYWTFLSRGSQFGPNCDHNGQSKRMYTAETRNWTSF